MAVTIGWDGVEFLVKTFDWKTLNLNLTLVVHLARYGMLRQSHNPLGAPGHEFVHDTHLPC
jgi:hypothetical protein